MQDFVKSVLSRIHLDGVYNNILSSELWTVERNEGHSRDVGRFGRIVFSNVISYINSSN